MLYSCTHMAIVGVRGLQNIEKITKNETGSIGLWERRRQGKTCCMVCRCPASPTTKHTRTHNSRAQRCSNLIKHHYRRRGNPEPHYYSTTVSNTTYTSTTDWQRQYNTTIEYSFLLHFSNRSVVVSFPTYRSYFSFCFLLVPTFCLVLVADYFSFSFHVTY